MIPQSSPSSAETPPSPGRSWRRWFAPGAWWALGFFILARIALEPLRSVPQFDDQGMDPYGAVEEFVLRSNRRPIEVAFFGSSQTIWGIVPDRARLPLGIKPGRVVNLGTAGGTPFEMWNLVRRNPGAFDQLRLAVIEVNPFVLRPGLEGDPRVFAGISWRATLGERLMLRDPTVRAWQLGEWILPLNSVRRSLESAVFNLAGKRRARLLNPDLDQRTQPGRDWASDNTRPVPQRERHTITAERAASRLVERWQVSAFQDKAMRSLIRWFEKRRIPVVLHQFPVQQELADLIEQHPRFAPGYADYLEYVHELAPMAAATLLTLNPADAGLDNTGFADRTHLNERGASSYSKTIATKARPFLKRPKRSR